MRARLFVIIGILGTLAVLALAFYVAPRSSEKTYGALLNHHALEPKINFDTIEAIPDNDYEAIVLIAPNHFFRGYGSITTTNREWETANGVLPSNSSYITKLFRDTQIFLDDTPFEREHGITVPLEQLTTRFSHTPVIPIVVKDTASFDEVITFTSQINHVLPKNILVVGSFDFAHDIPSAMAEFHDELSKEMVMTADTRAIFDRADVDSRPGLALFIELLHLRGSSQFELRTNTNVGVLMNQSWTKENVSYITGVFYPGPPRAPRNIETTLWVPGVVTSTWANAVPRMRYGQDEVRFLGSDDLCIYGAVREDESVRVFAAPFENFQWTSREKFSTIRCNIEQSIFYEK